MYRYIMGFSKLEVDLEKAQSMKDWLTPICIRELQKYLGFAY